MARVEKIVSFSITSQESKFRSSKAIRCGVALIYLLLFDLEENIILKKHPVQKIQATFNFLST